MGTKITDVLSGGNDDLTRMTGDPNYVVGSAWSEASGSNAWKDLWSSSNQFNHNENLWSWQRNELSAQNARDWSKMMSDTAMQRSVKDYEAAGFSPLAALQGGGASTPTAAVATSGSAHAGSSSGKGPQVLGSVLSTIAMMVGASVGSASKAAAAANASEQASTDLAFRKANLAYKIGRSSNSTERLHQQAIDFLHDYFEANGK